MSEAKPTRRTFLTTAALAAAATTTPLLRPSVARAQTAGGTVPKRIIFFYGGSGSMPGRWEPRAAAGAPEPTETSFELGELHAPLAAHKRDLIYLENLDMVSQRLDPTGAANAHIDGATHALTGANRATARTPGAVSIDQLIAQRLNAGGPVTRLPSLEMIAATWFNGDLSGEAVSSSSGSGAFVPVIWDPREVYRRLFPDPLPTGDNGAARRNHAFDFARRRFGRLAGRLGAEDRARLMQHEDTLAQLQRSLGLTTGVRASNRPPMSILDPLNGVAFRYGVSDAEYARYWSLTSELNVRMAVAAVHCDATRVVTLNIGDAPNALIGYTDGQYGVPDAHELIHRVMDPRSEQARTPAAVNVIRDMHLQTSRLFALLLDELASRTETDGQRLLDHTLVVWVSQIANGSHSTRALPWIVAGNANGYFRTGRYIRYARQPWMGRADDTVGRPHNDLFVSLANAMDVPITTFGNPMTCNGPLAGLRA